MNFEPKTSYTINDLKAIAGDNYIMFLSSSPMPSFPEPNKSPIYSFADFDNNTKQVYSNLYSLISSLNTGKDFLIFAVGPRVTGKWLTKEEADSINLQYGTSETETPYEYWSTAKILPSTMELASLGASTKILLSSSNKSHSIAIPPPNE